MNIILQKLNNVLLSTVESMFSFSLSLCTVMQACKTRAEIRLLEAWVFSDVLEGTPKLLLERRPA